MTENYSGSRSGVGVPARGEKGLRGSLRGVRALASLFSIPDISMSLKAESLPSGFLHHELGRRYRKNFTLPSNMMLHTCVDTNYTSVFVFIEESTRKF